jgi:hypothetical protein
MALDASKVRTYVIDLLKEKKALTEREVKAAIGKAFKVNPKTIGAGVIREVRKRMGIDRQSALAHARAILRKEPLLEAKKVINAIGERFGVRLGPPDVSRLRPRKARAGRGRARKAAAPAKAARTPKAAAPVKVAASKRRGRKTARTAARASARVRKAGAGRVTVSFEGTGDPADLAAFFLTLGK